MTGDEETISNSDDALCRTDLPRQGWVGAKLTEIMESWPLQIRVFTGSEDFIAELSLDAVIESRTGILSPGDLFPGDQVDIYIESDSTQPNQYHVTHIKKR